MHEGQVSFGEGGESGVAGDATCVQHARVHHSHFIGDRTEAEWGPVCAATLLKDAARQRGFWGCGSQIDVPKCFTPLSNRG